MEQREKSMSADLTAKDEAVAEVARPARYVADSDVPPPSEPEARVKPKKSSGRKNQLRETRIEKMMSKAELARRANLSVLTIDRVEKGLGCRMDTKRKILEALGLSLADRVRVFGEEE
jgi:DNA-binding XRE family transcriptional regulator